MNTALWIQHCSISTKFHMLVDYDVRNWSPTLQNFYRSPFSKWSPKYRKNSTLFDFKGSFWFIFIRPSFIIYLHMKCRWNQTLLNLCGIVVAILKMATGRNFSMSGHHYLPTYQILMILDNVEFLRPFWKWRLLEIFQCRE
jgi:hypothetical protein